MQRFFSSVRRRLSVLGWQDIASAPFDCAIELAVIDDKRHPLGFPCIRRTDGWFNLGTMQAVKASPTHWPACPAAPLES